MVETEEFFRKIRDVIETLIIEEHIDTFLFCGKNKFNYLCFHVATLLKQEYPHIRRIKANVGFPIIDGDFSEMNLEHYFDDVYYPSRYLNEKTMIYQGESLTERIDMSGFCISYSGESDDFMDELMQESDGMTIETATEYAKSKGARVIQI